MQGYYNIINKKDWGYFCMRDFFIKFKYALITAFCLCLFIKFDCCAYAADWYVSPSGNVTYANVVFSYGSEKFISLCKETGVDGIILPDLPFEEKEEFSPVCDKYGVDLISLIAPTSENRISMIAKEAQGFIYIVSSLGVTGTRSEIKTDLDSIVKVIRENTDIPCAIGFGISTPEQAAKMAAISDGAIVGSAIIKILEKYGKEAPKYVGEYVKSMKEAL